MKILLSNRFIILLCFIDQEIKTLLLILMLAETSLHQFLLGLQSWLLLAELQRGLRTGDQFMLWPLTWETTAQAPPQELYSTIIMRDGI